MLGSFVNQQKYATGSMGRKIEQVLSTNQVLCLHKLLTTIQTKGHKFDGLDNFPNPLPLSPPPSKNDGLFVRQRELGMQPVNQD